jgi:predicted transposase YdaD
MSRIGRFRALAEAREIQRRENAARMEYLRREGWETGLEEGRKMGRQVGLEAGREEGLEAGRKEGLEMGREEGQREGSRQKQLEIARKMKAEGFSGEQIARFTGLSLEDGET